MANPARLRILVVGGASGTLGKAVAAELAARHAVVTAGAKSGDVRLDLTDAASIVAGLAGAGPLDAVACCAGGAKFAPLSAFAPADLAQSGFALGLASKLMGQVNLALAARDMLRDGGSITLITGILSEQPIATGASSSMANGAIEAFARSAALELPRGLRINVVCPSVFEESMGKYAPYFRGIEPVPVARAARAYSRSVEGHMTGQVFKVF